MRCDAYEAHEARGAHEPVAVVRDGDDIVVCTGAVDRVSADGPAALAALDQVWERGGFWVGAIAYDLGRTIEPLPCRGVAPRDDRGTRDVVFTRYANRTVLRPPATPAVAELAVTAPNGTARHDTALLGVELGPMTSSMTREQHAAAVAVIHHHLRAGDCYQVNLTRRLSTERRADPRALFAAISARNPAPHAALVDLDGATLVSASPERFLRIEHGVVETRPIKGTHAVASALAASRKDLAEHVMIVDMARNDLGRVCELGRVGVDSLATIEHHPGLVHMVSTVRGTLRPDAGLAAVIRATFPPASITGAPKPRVMQIIDALEPVRRGYYCGAHGWIDADRRRADLAVTIRSFVVSDHGTDLAVGGGVVADSTADGEWSESCLKAARLLDAAGAYEAGAYEAGDYEAPHGGTEPTTTTAMAVAR